MKRFIIATLVAGAMLAAMLPGTAQAVDVTWPYATHSVIYPVVEGGRVDRTIIHFDPTGPVPHYLVVYQGDVWADDWNSAPEVYRADAQQDTVRWGGEKAGGNLVDADADGVTYAACVFPVGMTRDDTIVDAMYCATIIVVHVDRTFDVVNGRAGKAALSAKVVGRCRVAKQQIAMLVKCRRNSAAVLRYKVKVPVLGPEQTFTGGQDSWVRSGDFRGSLDTAVTASGVRVMTDSGYWGKVRRVFKSFEVRERY